MSLELERTALLVHPIACLADNYAYLLDARDGRCAVVDPSEAEPVLQALDEGSLRLEEIWLTHHHWDHVGGVEELARKFHGITVRASRYDFDRRRIGGQTHAACHGERFALGSRAVDVMEIPGHTLGAVCYLIEGNAFTGDTLFLGGCGRVFEGTMELMHASLMTLRSLADETRIWCGHEYTVRNLEYARLSEPDNDDVVRLLAEARARRARSEPTVPGLLRTERTVNPFLRCDVPSIARGRDPVTAFTALREGKDRL